MSNGSTGGDFDLSQFHGVFFDEAAEHLQAMESLLLEIDIANADDEQLNAIFRAAHSIKGGAATFGFADITELTHEMETVFDRVRKGQMDLSTALVNAFLAAGDMLRSMLAARSSGADAVPQSEVAELCGRMRAFLDSGAGADGPVPVTLAVSAPPPAAPGAAPAAAAPQGAATPAPAAGPKELEIVFGPFDQRVTPASVDGVIADLAGFGEVRDVPPGASADSGAKRARRGKLPAVRERRIRLVTDTPVADLVDALGFMFEADRVRVAVIQPAAAAPSAPAGPAMPAEDERFGLFVDPATLPTGAASMAAATSGIADVPAPVQPLERGTELKPVPKAAPPQAADPASIRVNIQKVDQLINLVGELVITQAMLAQTASDADPVLYESLFNGLATLERNTRDLQEAAMSIRMLPMSFAFSRFPRVVRDTAAKLGKEVELHLVGEGTELDKGLIERIVDPLTHLVRNSLDHGLELPDEREAVGKSRKGSITLRAYHQSGAIVIEVSDDGRGLRRDRILEKARERGMAVSDTMADAEVWNLIFEAGFSTAEQVTDVSGRGVGMDVVRRNIQEMSGRVEIESAAGVGTRISIKLPLTLAILDGMSVRVGREIYIIPLGYISESMQPRPEAISTLAGQGQVVAVRGDYLPVVSLGSLFGVRADKQRPEDGVLVILENEGRLTALFVDALVGQHQVVIKSLENNFRKVAGVSGATIMGDGRVALILDVAHLVAATHNRLAQAA